MQRFAVIGLALTVAGVVLAVGFWPLVSLSGVQLLAARSGNQYPAYAPDTRILIRERVIGIAFASFFGTQLTASNWMTATPMCLHTSTSKGMHGPSWQPTR